MMMGFEGYSFCKPHFSQLHPGGLQVRLSQGHYPAEFMAAVISNGGGYYSTFGYLSESDAWGSSSCLRTSMKARSSTRARTKTSSGPHATQGALSRRCGVIVRERSKHGPFTSLDHFLFEHPAMSISRTCVFSSRQAALILSPWGDPACFFCGRPFAFSILLLCLLRSTVLSLMLSAPFPSYSKERITSPQELSLPRRRESRRIQNTGFRLRGNDETVISAMNPATLPYHLHSCSSTSSKPLFLSFIHPWTATQMS